MFANGSEDGGKSQACALPHFLGCEERLEDTFQGLSIHADSRVHYGEFHVAAGFDVVWARGTEVSIERNRRGREDDLAALRYRIAGVDGEVQKRALQLTRVAFGDRRQRFQSLVDDDPWVDGSLQDRDDFGDEFVNIHVHGLLLPFAGKSKELLGEVGGAQGRVQYGLGITLQSGVAVQVIHKDLRIPQYAAQQVVEVVGDAARELTHRLEFLALSKLLFQLVLFRNIAKDQHHAHTLAFLIENGRAAEGNLSFGAVFGHQRGMVHRSYHLALAQYAGHGVLEGLTCLRVDQP